MENIKPLLSQIKNAVVATEPSATVILYGSYARGDFHEDSDIDILILIDKDKVTNDDWDRIRHPIYNIELETGLPVSVNIYAPIPISTFGIL